MGQAICDHGVWDSRRQGRWDLRSAVKKCFADESTTVKCFKMDGGMFGDELRSPLNRTIQSEQLVEYGKVRYQIFSYPVVSGNWTMAWRMTWEYLITAMTDQVKMTFFRCHDFAPWGWKGVSNCTSLLLKSRTSKPGTDQHRCQVVLERLQDWSENGTSTIKSFFPTMQKWSGSKTLTYRGGTPNSWRETTAVVWPRERLWCGKSTRQYFKRRCIVRGSCWEHTQEWDRERMSKHHFNSERALARWAIQPRKWLQVNIKNFRPNRWLHQEQTNLQHQPRSSPLRRIHISNPPQHSTTTALNMSYISNYRPGAEVYP